MYVAPLVMIIISKNLTMIPTINISFLASFARDQIQILRRHILVLVLPQVSSWKLSHECMRL